MRIVMMGTGLFAEPTFEALLAAKMSVVGLVTQPDRAIGAERASTRQTGRGMKTIAEEQAVPVFQPEKINSPEGIAGLHELQPELLVVAAYGQILSQDVLAIPARGGINVHASLLPKYRGAAPVAWAIYHGETKTGVTIIKMSITLDAGDMLAKEEVEIGPEETAGELEARLAPLGAQLARQVIEQIEAGTIKGRKQDPWQVTKAPKLTKEHGVINWHKPASAVCAQIRAMQPWPTAFTFWQRLEQEPVRVILNRAIPAEGEILPAGSILPGDGSRLLVAAGGATVVEILELQPAGKRRMSGADFLRGGRQIQSGDRFGPGPAP